MNPQLFQNLETVTACLACRDEIMSTGRAAEIKTLLKTAPKNEKKLLGQELNQLRMEVQAACDARIQEIQAEQEKDVFVNFDPTFYLTDTPTTPGRLHPITELTAEIVQIFTRLGFDVYEGSLIRTQYFNFTSMNTPEHHPARDLQDTFYLEEKDEDGEAYLLRTQMSGNAVEYARSHKPPFRVIFPGIVFRNENMDATHDINFTQFDMWLVNKDVKLSHLITLAKLFFAEFFQAEDLQVRLRPSYFPFTQPSLEGDISCPFCGGKGCRVCKQTGWIEVFGAGPIHEKVLENMELPPREDGEEWTGMAWGFGIDRLAQLRLGVSGITQFYNGNLKFLRGQD